MPYQTKHDKNRANLFKKIRFLKKQCPVLHRQKRRYWISMMNDRYQYVIFFNCFGKKYLTKIRTSQRTSEAKDITHDTVTYPVYWDNYQKCAILGKSSIHVLFIFVSYLSQKTDLSRGRVRQPSNYLFCRLSPSLSLERLSCLHGTVLDTITLLAP